jgi:hypothetical protein
MTVASLKGPMDREAEGHVSYEEHAPWLTVNDGLPKFVGKSETVFKG